MCSTYDSQQQHKNLAAMPSVLDYRTKWRASTIQCDTMYCV